MRAIYAKKVYVVNRQTPDGVELITLDGPRHEIFYVGHFDRELTLIFDDPKEVFDNPLSPR